MAWKRLAENDGLMASTSWKLFCQALGHENRCLGQAFLVPASTGTTVHELKKDIYKKLPRPALEHFEGLKLTDLALWRLSEPLPLEECECALADLRFPDPMSDDETLTNQEPKVALLIPFHEIRECWDEEPPECHLHLVMRVPQSVGTADNTDDIEQPHQQQTLSSDLFQQYQSVIIKVKNWGAFEFSDIELNDVTVHEYPVPDFVTKFETKLDSKPGLASHARVACECFRDSQCRDAYLYCDDSAAANESYEDTKQPWRYAERTEILHIVDLANSNWERLWGGRGERYFKNNNFDGPLAEVMFFYHLVLHVSDNDKRITAQLGIDNTSATRFKFVMTSAAIHPTQDQRDQLRMYVPCGDLLILKSALPRLLVQVNSTLEEWDDWSMEVWSPDLIRMLLQGAAIVRFVNGFLNAKKDFVFVFFFIWNDGEAARYTLFQQNGQAVYYRKKVFSLSAALGRVEFARQLYNFLHVLGEDKDTGAKISEFKSKIWDHRRKFFMKSFFTKDTEETDTESSCSSDDEGISAADRAVLKLHGYKVIPEITVDDRGGKWEPLFRLPPHILTVYRSLHRKEKLIAKKVRGGSNELEILRLLHTYQPEPEHVISLLDSFHTPSGSWAILPKMTTVTYYLRFEPGKLKNKVTRICLGLIKGLAYLHQRHIAHRDIKLDNLVVGQGFCLKIIDFDFAMRVKNEVDGQCGTKHWLAPEIVRLSRYSPIKADRWSCGHVILSILDSLEKERKLLRAVAMRLKANDPDERPSLLEWHTWFAAPPPPQDVSNVWNGGQPNALRPQEATMDANGERMEPPKGEEAACSG